MKYRAYLIQSVLIVNSKSPVFNSRHYIWILSNLDPFWINFLQAYTDAPPFGKAYGTWVLLAPELRRWQKAKKPPLHHRIYCQRHMTQCQMMLKAMKRKAEEDYVLSLNVKFTISTFWCNLPLLIYVIMIAHGNSWPVCQGQKQSNILKRLCY